MRLRVRFLLNRNSDRDAGFSGFGCVDARWTVGCRASTSNVFHRRRHLPNDYRLVIVLRPFLYSQLPLLVSFSVFPR